MNCGKSVSTPVPRDTIVRAYVECPECLEVGPLAKAEARARELEANYQTALDAWNNEANHRRRLEADRTSIIEATKTVGIVWRENEDGAEYPVNDRARRLEEAIRNYLMVWGTDRSQARELETALNPPSVTEGTR